METYLRFQSGQKYPAGAPSTEFFCDSGSSSFQAVILRFSGKDDKFFPRVLNIFAVNSV